MLSRRISSLSPSATMAIMEKAKMMKAQGVDIISLSVGEPDFDTPEIIKQAAIRALKNGFTKYTPTAGIPELKKVIIQKLKKDNKLTYTPPEVVVSCGAKHSIFNSLQVLCNPGDEVIIPSPYWVSYPEQVKSTGAKCVFALTKEEDNFKLKVKAIADKISRRTKVIIINSPNNPTGAVYDSRDLKAIAELAVRKKIFVVSDEVYEKLIYGKARHISIASFGKKIKDLTIVVNGVSKAYAMTGWRIGFAAGPVEVMKLAARFQGHVTSNPASMAQQAAVVAHQKGSSSTRRMVAEFSKRRRYIINRLNQMPFISCPEPQGAFYVFPNIKRLFRRTYKGRLIKDSFRLTELLLAEAYIATVPGKAFGDDNYIRMSYANSLKNLTQAMGRLISFLNLVR